MSDFRYAPIYGRNPWLMVEDADEVADFFRNSGTPFVSHRRDIVHFGSQPHVYWIESGLVASSATTDVDKVRWIGLFSRRTLLGSVRAIGHGKAAMTLMATAVTDVSGFAVPLELYARWVSENPERERAMLLNCIAKSECQVEGVLVNDLCSVDDRVEIAVAVLFRAAGITEAQLPAALPWNIPVSDIASLVHAERAMTSRAVGRMVSSGLLERSGRTFVLKAVPPNCTVVGNPGRIVRREGVAPQIDLDHVHLPDPIREHIVALERRVSELEEQMHNHYGTTVFKEDIQDDADL